MFPKYKNQFKVYDQLNINKNTMLVNRGIGSSFEIGFRI
jgi:hypothetical protein